MKITSNLVLVLFHKQNLIPGTRSRLWKSDL